MKKKILSLILACGLVVSMTACIDKVIAAENEQFQAFLAAKQ